MRLRTRRASKRTVATIAPQSRHRSDLERVGTTLAQLFHGAMPTAGDNDARWFETVAPGAELVPFAIPRADVHTITGALCEGNPDGSINPARINLGLRFAHMRLDRIRHGSAGKGGQNNPLE